MSEWDAFPAAAPASDAWAAFPVSTLAPATPPSTGEDVARSALPSLARGASHVVGLPGEIGSLVAAGARAAGVPEDFRRTYGAWAASNPIMRPFTGPTSHDVEQAIETRTGPLYRAQTPVGKLTSGGLEMVPAALAGPISAGRSLAVGMGRNAFRYGAVPGVAGEAAVQGTGTEGSWAEPYVRGATVIGTGGVLAWRDRPTVVPQQVAGQNAAPDFNIRMSHGQANRDVEAQILENAALRGGLGPQAQRTAEEFFGNAQNPVGQIADIEAARTGVARGLDRFGSNVTNTRQETGELVGESVRRAEDIAQRNVGRAYDEALALPGQFHPGAFEGVGDRIRSRLFNDPRSPIFVDEGLPNANRAITYLEGTPGSLAPRNIAAGDQFVGVNMQGVDQTRKRLQSLLRAAPPGSEDRRAVGRIIGAFEHETEDAIARGLFTGDERALPAIRAARRANREYMQQFRAAGSIDPAEREAGRAIERITGRNGGEGATATETARYLLGEAKTGATGSSVRLARRLEQILGADSPEWSGVRQGLWHNLTSPAPGATGWGPQKVAERITEFVNGSGRPMASVAFSQEERDLMLRYARAMRELVPMQGTVNYSNSATVGARLLANSQVGHILNAIAHKIGGSPGSMALHMVQRYVQPSLNNAAVRRSIYGQEYRTGNAEALGRTGLVGVPAVEHGTQ